MHIWETFQAWLAAPYHGEMSALQIFLLIGLVLVFIVLWTRILARISEEL
jgi:hypothetical protein